jgi:hypothetical protein
MCNLPMELEIGLRRMRFSSKLLACDEDGVNCALNIKDELHRAVKKYNFDLNDCSTT